MLTYKNNHICWNNVLVDDNLDHEEIKVFIEEGMRIYDVMDRISFEKLKPFITKENADTPILNNCSWGLFSCYVQKNNLTAVKYFISLGLKIHTSDMIHIISDERYLEMFCYLIDKFDYKLLLKYNMPNSFRNVIKELYGINNNGDISIFWNACFYKDYAFIKANKIRGTKANDLIKLSKTNYF